MNSPHRPVKSLGQNFLVDERVQQKIADACQLKSDDIVLEIGPGKAAITRRILPLVKRLIVIEKDRQLAAMLQQLFPKASVGNLESGPPTENTCLPAGRFGGDNLTIVNADFLKWDMSSLSPGTIVVGNIPYYISTPIIEQILEHRQKVARAYLTVQLEFGERLAAKAGSKDYGSLSCFVQYYADVKVLFKISPGSFHPKPKVDSCLVSLVMKSKPEFAAKDEEKLFKMIQTAFMQRRKTIMNALGVMFDKEQLMSILTELKINPKSRPEDLTLLNYIEISNKLLI